MIEWEDKYNVGVSIIDEGHKRLIDIINKVIVAKQHKNNPEEISKIYNEIAKYAHGLFKTEESFMIKFNYSKYEYHKKEHNDFSIKILVYESTIIYSDYQDANVILEYFKQWLVNHIQNTDKRFLDCFKKNGLK